MKIAYVVDCMYNSGGTERVLSICANALSEYYDITIVTAFQQNRPDFFSLCPKVMRYDLGINEDLSGIQKKKVYEQRLSGYLQKERFDIALSLGGMDLDFLHSINDGSKKIIWLHYAIDIAKTSWIGPRPSLIKKIKAQLITWKRIYFARKYEQIVLISKADLNKWVRYTDKASFIYNPLTINSSSVSNLLAKRVIAVGRLDYQKGFDYLIDAWSLVAEKHKDWHLNIFGEGDLRKVLHNQIEGLGLQNCITLCGRTSDIEKEYAKHSIFVLSSRGEGFGLVLVEAASCGLPLVSFDCPSGPSEIIEDGKNGFLVEKVGDVQTMADRICRLIENESLRRQMGENAKSMVNKFSVDEIKEQWILLLNRL